jgi:protein-S-isoprenylcysteine O-methyltransferase Ste14
MSWRIRNLPLPEGYLVGLAVAFALHRAHLNPSVRSLGWALIVGGAGLVMGSVRTAGEVDLEQANRLVTTGPYAYVRNPMYAGWALASLGAGLVTNSGWIVAATPLAAWWTHRDVLREESHLAARFGEEFTAYRARVPRYL